MFNDDDYMYFKLPKAMGSALIKACIQSSISMTYDQRSNPDRLNAAKFILLNFANEVGNTERIDSSKASVLNSVFEPENTESINHEE